MIKSLNERKILLIFDGLDEVPCKIDIMKYLKIEEVFQAKSDIRSIFTCRKE